MLIGKTIIIFIIYMATFYVYGLLFNRITRRKETDLTITLVAGMFIYALEFMLFAIPLKYIKNPLSVTSSIWMGIWILSVIIIALICRKEALEPIRYCVKFIASHKLNAFLFFVVMMAQIIFVEIYGRWSGSNNPSEYVAYVTTAVFTNEIGTTDPRTGLYLTAFEPRTFTQTFLDHSAVVSKIFNLHPLMEIRTVNPAVFLIIGNLLIFLLARTMLKDSDAKQWLFYCVYMYVLCMSASSVLLQGFYIFFRNYEGKNVYSAIMVPLMFYVIWKLYEQPRDKVILTLGVLCIAGSFHYTGIALFTIPMVTLGLLPGVFSKKNWKRMICNIIVLNIPILLYAIYYIGTEAGYITLKI